ncbi:helix-turn-helix transcriptional regulator [Leifsonia kafniensis]|uniref:Helix-turn-helix transcriptional regulator n=1 Tax=Leifsonia kafniensis TaxID=475957 RepID=A0ABP7K8Y6_9MICO
MVRVPLSPEELKRGKDLGAALRTARGPQTMVSTAARAGVSVETLRKIETGRSPSPEFFTIQRICSALGIAMDDLLTHRSGSDRERAVAAAIPARP